MKFEEGGILIMELKAILANLEGLKVKGNLDIDVPNIKNYCSEG